MLNCQTKTRLRSQKQYDLSEKYDDLNNRCFIFQKTGEKYDAPKQVGSDTALSG